MRRLCQEYTGPRHGSTRCTPTLRRQSQRHPEFEVSCCYIKDNMFTKSRKKKKEREKDSHRHVKKSNQI